MHGKLLAGLLTTLMACSAFACPQGDQACRTNVNASIYISGGVGDEEIALLNDKAKEFNLKLLFAQSDGAYLADVDVVIRDTKGTIRFWGNNLGPILLVQLPKGNYEITAASREKAIAIKKSVNARAHNTMLFVWK